jgi:hypothetical protein
VNPKLNPLHRLSKIIFYAFHCSGPKPGFESAAFPNGLPQALEASVAFQSHGEGTSSDYDHGGAHVYQCKSGDPCQCIVPRPRIRARGGTFDQQHNAAVSGPQQDMSGPSSSQTPSRTSSQILARIAELRPVLPRPGPVHNPSTGLAHEHVSRHHDNKPYKHAAYGMTHQHIVHPPSYPSPGPSNPPFSYNEQTYNDQMQMGQTPAWPQTGENAGFDNSFPSMCGCGDDCSCPGCTQHNRAMVIPSSSAYASCTNPGACATCLDCTIMSLPASAILPPDTALSIYDSQIQNDAIDEWLRQTSASISSHAPSPPPFQQSIPLHGSQFQQQSPGWNNRDGFPFSDQQTNTGREPPRGAPASSFNYGSSSVQSMMPFGPSSTDRGSVVPNQPSRGHRSQASITNLDSQIDPRLFPSGGMMNDSQYLNLPDQSRSRSPSTSSQSSHQGSESHGTEPIPPYRPSGRMQGMFTNTQGVRSAPQLNIRPNMHRGPNSASSASISPSPGSGSSARRPPYASSNPESRSSDYDPSFAGLQIC